MHLRAAAALRWACFYRSLGFQPLPSRAATKAPDLPGYARYWDEPVPDTLFRPACWRAGNVQLVCGRRFGLVVVDCDGPRAEAAWARACARRGHHGRTWQVRTGGGGLHVYYRVAPAGPADRSRRLWGRWDAHAGPRGTGDWAGHLEVRLLGAKSLVVAPPSRHVATGRPYEFLEGHSPDTLFQPAEAPDWLLALPALRPPRAANPAPAGPRPGAPPRGPAPAAGADRDRVLAALPDKLDLAEGWGLRPATRRPNAGGWVACHAIDREDRRPSASLHVESGVYVDHRDRTALSFFDLASALAPDRWPTWREARDALARDWLPGRVAG